MERGGRGRISSGMLPLLAIQVANEYYRRGNKPPVTAGLLLANTLVYIRPGPLHKILPRIDEVWFNPYLIVKYKDMKRFFLSAFYHTGESHLFYNMVSLLWKGIHLESSMGSVDFASMVATLLGLSQGITLIMAKMLLVLFDYETAYYRQYAVGFSGVLFAWAELFLIQLFMPGVSFLGHLGGILAGMLYLWMKGRQSSPDPLTSLIKHVVGLVGWPFRFIKNIFRNRRNRISGRGRVGEGRFGPSVSGTWRCRICTYDNSDWNDVCEMCNTERSYHVSQQPNMVSLEELRRRRLERFSS